MKTSKYLRTQYKPNLRRLIPLFIVCWASPTLSPWFFILAALALIAALFTVMAWANDWRA